MATAQASEVGMKYRLLGDSGLLVSAFAIGGWVVFDGEDGTDKAYELLAHAYKHGVNFWDTAENYGDGHSERVIGKALQRGVEDKIWMREDIVISTKLFVGTKDGPNARGLSRKHLIEGTKASIARLGVDYVDVLFCHRIDKYTPIEEVVRAMNFIIAQGWAFYWGTSEWFESDIMEACEIADRLGMIRPVVEQPQYNLFERSKVEVDYTTLYKRYKTGLTPWSPLAFGVLTGKYATGIPEGSRLANDHLAGLVPDLHARIAKVEQLRPIADKLGCSLAQLALAWCASNEHVSSVLLGASSVAQLDENLQAFRFVAKITRDVKAQIDAVIPFEYAAAERDFFYTIRAPYLA